VTTASGSMVEAGTGGGPKFEDFNRTVASVSLNDLLPQWNAPIWSGPWVLGGYQWQNVGYPQYQTYTDVDGSAARFLFPVDAYDGPSVGITDANAPWTKDSFVFTTRLTVDWSHDLNWEWFFGGFSLNLYLDQHNSWWADEWYLGNNSIYFANVTYDPAQPNFGADQAATGQYDLPVFPEGPLALLLTMEFTKGGVVRAKVMQEGAADPGWQIYFTDHDPGDREGHDSRTYFNGVQELPKFSFRTHYNDNYLGDSNGYTGHVGGNVVAYDYIDFQTSPTPAGGELVVGSAR
jgi:hypothetical protein